MASNSRNTDECLATTIKSAQGDSENTLQSPAERDRTVSEQGRADHTDGVPAGQGYLNEARAYHVRYAYTGQMLSTMMSPAVAKHLLQEASHVMDLLNHDHLGTTLLREDNEKMMRDVELSPPDTGREGSVLSPDMCPELGFPDGEREIDDEEKEFSESESSADGDEGL